MTSYSVRLTAHHHEQPVTPWKARARRSPLGMRPQPIGVLLPPQRETHSARRTDDRGSGELVQHDLEPFHPSDGVPDVVARVFTQPVGFRLARAEVVLAVPQRDGQ